MHWSICPGMVVGWSWDIGLDVWVYLSRDDPRMVLGYNWTIHKYLDSEYIMYNGKIEQEFKLEALGFCSPYSRVCILRIVLGWYKDMELARIYDSIGRKL